MRCLLRFPVLYLALVLFSMTIPEFLYADLGDFGDAVKEEQEDEPEVEQEQTDDEEDELDESESEFLSALFDLTFGLWVFHNLSTWYPAYPYDVDSQGIAAAGHYYGSFDSPTDLNPRLKKSRMSFFLSGGGFAVDSDYGYTASFRMTSKILAAFGTDLEYRWWGDDSGDLHFLRAGGLLPLVQTDIFSLDLAMAGAFYFDLFSLSGFTFGAVLTSYPIAPLSLELRGGGIFSSSVNLGEIGFKVGIHLKRFEIFLGYYGLLQKELTLNALDLGIGLHF